MMFAIVLRLIADGAKADPVRNLDVLPDVNKAMPLVLEEDKWYVMNVGDAPTVFGRLNRAQNEHRNLVDDVTFKRAAAVKHVLGVIADFKSKYGGRNCAHQAFIELQVLSPTKVDDCEINLSQF
jgi:hypothetical protein